MKKQLFSWAIVRPLTFCKLCFWNMTGTNVAEELTKMKKPRSKLVELNKNSYFLTAMFKNCTETWSKKRENRTILLLTRLIKRCLFALMLLLEAWISRELLGSSNGTLAVTSKNTSIEWAEPQELQLREVRLVLSCQTKLNMSNSSRKSIKSH